MIEKLENNIENNNNNTLSIIDESQSKDKTLQKQIKAPSGNIPIKSIKKFKLAEDYYSYYYSEYKLYKLGNILFCKMGNLFTFNFDKNKNFKPKFSIGPNWYMTLSLNIVIIIFTIILYSLIIRKLNIIFGIIYITLSLFTIFCVSRTALIHTEIAMNKYPDSINNVYCNKCKVYYNGFEKVDHCDLCKVCIIKFDHHCVWVGKCVGKDNLYSFFQMIIIGSIFYLFLIACVIIYNIK